MSHTDRIYPDEPAGEFPDPPKTFTDRKDRTIEIRPYDDDFEALVDMYVQFDPADRAQGIPPSGEGSVREWLSVIVDGDAVNVVAWHADSAVGHATLVPDHTAHELAIFVLQDYQRAGIGSALITTLLGYGQQRGVKRVWLTVERWNRAAVGLYKKVGFETSDAESFELEMTLRLE